jgi:hypothetical protein
MLPLSTYRPSERAVGYAGIDEKGSGGREESEIRGRGLLAASSTGRPDEARRGAASASDGQ